MDTVGIVVNHSKNVGFHEKYQFFLLWGMFIVTTLNIGLQELKDNKHNHISYIPLFISFAFQYFIHMPEYESMILTTVITILNICIPVSPFGISYRFISLYYVWQYATKYASFEDSLTHFTFYGISSLYGIPLISYINSIYLIDKWSLYLLSGLLQVIQCLLFWFGKTCESLTPETWNHKNTWISLIVFLYSWSTQLEESFINIDNTFVNDLGKIQYGLIGMTVFISACASLCFKHIRWDIIMYLYFIIYYVLHSKIIPIDYSKPELTVLNTSLKYLIYQPGMYMLFTDQKYYNLIQGFMLSFLSFACSKMIPYINHYVTDFVLLTITLCCVFKLRRIAPTCETYISSV